jgi:ADP-ribose pyrophosphatase YjhB (NUDIX family)
MQCVIHGSFRKHLPEIQQAINWFTEAGIKVLAPGTTEVSGETNGFVTFTGEENRDPRLIELEYLHKVKQLGKKGFSYFVNPEGYIGKSASYELGIAQVTNIPCFFMEPLDDHPAYLHRNSVMAPETLAFYFSETGRLPNPVSAPNEQAIHALWEELMVPGSVVATGGIIEYDDPRRRGRDPELLFVRTHKWGDRFSMVGGKVRRNETLKTALAREVKEETGLASRLGRHICTFDQIKNSGYYQQGTQHIFVDYAVQVDSRRVQLNDEAQDYVWMPAKEALASLDIEPNARHTLELYAAV